MTALTDLVADFVVEFDHLLHAQGVDEQRRALRAAQNGVINQKILRNLKCLQYR